MRISLSGKVKRGESLVEVMVALGIIMIAVSSAVSLVVHLTNMNLSSRKRTEMISMIQQYKSKYVSQYFTTGCNMAEGYSVDELNAIQANQDAADACPAAGPVPVAGCQYTVASELSDDEKNSGLDEAKYMKITSIGRWNEKGESVPRSFSVSQIIRK